MTQQYIETDLELGGKDLVILARYYPERGKYLLSIDSIAHTFSIVPSILYRKESKTVKGWIDAGHFPRIAFDAADRGNFKAQIFMDRCSKEAFRGAVAGDPACVEACQRGMAMGKPASRPSRKKQPKRRTTRKKPTNKGFQRQHQPRPKQGFVYLIEAEGTGQAKVGKAVRPKTRLKELQTGCPHRLILLGTVPGYSGLESQLHRKYADYRVSGEWFTLTDELRSEFT